MLSIARKRAPTRRPRESLFRPFAGLEVFYNIYKYFIIQAYRIRLLQELTLRGLHREKADSCQSRAFRHKHDTAASCAYVTCPTPDPSACGLLRALLSARTRQSHGSLCGIALLPSPSNAACRFVAESRKRQGPTQNRSDLRCRRKTVPRRSFDNEPAVP